MTNKKSILVIFGKERPKRSKKWWQQFDEVITAKDIERFVCPGSVEEAHRLAKEIANLVDDRGRKISKIINYKGYDLWWMHFDGLHHKFCLPFTQYQKLLDYLKGFERIYIFEPPHPYLFRYFLEAHNRQCVILKRFHLKRLLPVPFGVFLQIFLSILFLPFLILARPRVMVWMGDKLDHGKDYDFRMKFIYEELKKRRIPFVEFIRSLESWPVVLQHAWRRKRPVFYSGALVEFICVLSSLFKEDKKIARLCVLPDSEKHFWLLVATHDLRNIRGNILVIKILKFILRLIGVRAANISVGVGRTFHEVLACKLEGIKVVGMMHGASSCRYDVYDFMPGFDNKVTLSVDQYGVWSEWWKDYYVKNSDLYKPEQLFVSGPMRPLTRKECATSPKQNDGRLKVLYIAEELAFPEEVLPYILALLRNRDFELYFKFRPYRDNFELQLKENYPEVYKKILETTTVFRGTMEEAISRCDAVVGSYSTAVLEALLQLKTPIFFQTNKWGDHFGFKSAGLDSFFADNPRELMEGIKKSRKIAKEELKKLQGQFFGNPYRNGSKWLVEQLIRHAFIISKSRDPGR